MATAPEPRQRCPPPFVAVCAVVRELQSKEAENLVAANGLVVVGIEANVVAKDRALAIAITRIGAVSPAVNVPVQHDGAARLAIPAEHGVMAHHQAMTLGIAGSNLQVIAHVFPNLR